MVPSSMKIFVLILVQISESHPIKKRCLASPCRDDGESPNIKILLETVDDETRKPVQQATGYYIANKNYSLSLTPSPVTPTPFPTSHHPSLPHYIPPSSYQSTPLTSPNRPLHSFHFLPPSSSPSSIVRSPIFLRSDPLPSSHLVASVYKNPSGVVRPSSQLQPPPFVVVKKVSSPPPIEIITTPRSQATLTPTTTVSPLHRLPYTTPFTHSFHLIPPSTTSSTSTITTSPSSTTIQTPVPTLPTQLSMDRSITAPIPDRAETTTAPVAESSSRIEMSEEELRKRVMAMMNKNQLLCTMFSLCDGLSEKDVTPTVTPKTVYNPSPTERQFEFRPRIVTAATTPSPFQFVFEFASTIAPTLKKLNQQLPIFSAQYAANPSPIMPHPKGLNPKSLTLSSLLSSIVSSPLASHCPSCVQLLLNLCPTEGRSSKDCVVTTTAKPFIPPPTPSPTPMRSQPTFAFSFPNPITGQRIEAAAVVPSTTTLRPWQTTYHRAPSPTTTIDPFAPLMDDEVQYDFDFDKRPTEAIQYDEGGGYGLVGERRGVLPWSIKRAG